MSVKILKSHLHDLIQVGQHLNGDSDKQNSSFWTNLFSAVVSLFLPADKERELRPWLVYCFLIGLMSSW